MSCVLLLLFELKQKRPEPVAIHSHLLNSILRCWKSLSLFPSNQKGLSAEPANRKKVSRFRRQITVKPFPDRVRNSESISYSVSFTPFVAHRSRSSHPVIEGASNRNESREASSWLQLLLSFGGGCDDQVFIYFPLCPDCPS